LGPKFLVDQPAEDRAYDGVRQGGYDLVYPCFSGDFKTVDVSSFVDKIGGSRMA